MPAAIELKNISKRFGPVQANRDVSLNVESGTIMESLVRTEQGNPP